MHISVEAPRQQRGGEEWAKDVAATAVVDVLGYRIAVMAAVGGHA